MQSRLLRFPRESYIRRLGDVADELLTWANKYEERQAAMRPFWSSLEQRERAATRARECREIARGIEELYTRLYALR